MCVIGSTLAGYVIAWYLNLMPQLMMSFVVVFVVVIVNVVVGGIRSEVLSKNIYFCVFSVNCY